MTWLLIFYAPYCLACIWARFVSRRQERKAAIRLILGEIARDLVADSILGRAFRDAIVPQMLFRSEPIPVSDWGFHCTPKDFK